MPECSVKCPKVRRDLRKIVAETPWILKEGKPAADDNEIASYTAVTTWSHPKEKHVEPYPSGFKTTSRGAAEERIIEKSQYPTTIIEDVEAGASTKFTEKSDRIKEAAYKEKQQLERAKLISATDESGSYVDDRSGRRKGEEHIILQEVDAERSDVTSVKLNGKTRKGREIISDKMEAQSSHSSSSLEVSTRAKDKETSTRKRERGHDKALQKTDDAGKSTELTQTESHLTCSSICSKNISKERRIRKLVQRQRDVDSHLSSKGFSYFDDVCTCCLSCLVQQLSNDLFVQNILASIALFAVGIKLSIELDAWSIPMRIL